MNNLNCHPEDIEGSQPFHVSSRDIAENAKLNHEIAEELRKYKRRHPEHCEGSSQNKKALFHWILLAKALRMTCLLGTLFLLPSLAQAEQCTPTPKCEDLGYNQSSCPDGGGVKCPWNTSLMYCCKKCAPSCEVKTCQIGDVLYSDKKCYICLPSASPEQAPIGILFTLNKIVGLADIGKMNYSDAHSQCKNYTVSGTSGWYLPTKSELLAMNTNIDSIQSGLQSIEEGNQLAGSYWSSDMNHNKSNNAFIYIYTVNPASGYVSSYESRNSFNVRPVLAF